MNQKGLVWFLPIIIVAILGVIGIGMIAVMLEAIKLIIIAIVSVPLFAILKKYVNDQLIGFDNKVSIAVALALTFIILYVLYSTFMLLLIGSIVIFLIYFVITSFIDKIDFKKLFEKVSK